MSGDLQKAEEMFLKAIQMSWAYGNAHNGLGRVYLEQGRFDEAVKEFEIAKDRINASANNKSLLFRYSAGIWWEGHLPWDPNAYWVFKNLGIGSLLMGHIRDGISHFQKAEIRAKIKLSETNKDFAARYAIAIALLGMAEVDSSYAMTTEALTECAAKGVVDDFMRDLNLLARNDLLKEPISRIRGLVESSVSANGA